MTVAVKDITADDLGDLLKSVDACDDAIEWCDGKSATEAWATCELGDWMLWIAARLGVDRKLVVMQACKAARRALKFVFKGEDRPRKAIETAEAWCRGEATIKEVRAAAYAAAYAAADAANAANAAYAAYAAYAAADAADAAADDSIRLRVLKQIANDVRVGIPIELVIEASRKAVSG